jgi:hypothetical protein
MANDDIKKEEEVIEPDIEPITPGLDAPPAGVLEKIANVFRSKPKEEPVVDNEPEQEPEQDTELDTEPEINNEPELDNELDTEPKEEEDRFVEVDPRFAKIADEYGWSKDKIIDYAENHDEFDIIKLAGEMQKHITVKSQDDKPANKQAIINEEMLNSLAEKDEDLANTVRQILTPLATRFDNTSSELETLKGVLGEYEMDRQTQEEVRNQKTADELFDNSEISSLGKTDDITKYPDGTYVMNDPIVKERQKVWDVATKFYASGGTFKAAMKNALQWYGGGSAKKDAKRSVIKELKEQEKRVMPKRQDTKVEKQYASEEERKAAVINDAVRKYNKEFPA